MAHHEGKQINIRLTDEELARFDAMARQAGLSRGRLARSLIVAILEDEAKAERRGA